MKKCVIFGASSTGKSAYNILKEQYDCVAFADNDKCKWGQKFCGISIISPIDLQEYENIEIIVASTYYSSICMQLSKMNLKNVKVFFVYAPAIHGTKQDAEYRLFELAELDLHANCRFISEKVRKIEKDFSDNYVLHQSNKKRVLFCAYIFPPIGGAGVQRSLKFVKYLRKFNYEPVVLTAGKNNGKFPVDVSMIEEIDSNIEIIRIDEDIVLPEMLTDVQRQEIYNLYAGVFGTEKETNAFYENLSDNAVGFAPDNHIIWVNECLKQIEKKINLNTIDVIFTTGNPFSTYFLGYYIKKKYKTKWVMDYRDPWASMEFVYGKYHYNERKAYFMRTMEKALAVYADGIVSIANGMNKAMHHKYGIADNKLFEITNGYDEDDFSAINVADNLNNKFIICHNGTIYFDRNVVSILEGINELIYAGKIEKDKIQLLFNGNIEITWKQKIYTADKYGIVVFNGYLEHKKSLNIMMQSNILLLFGFQGDGAQIGYTGKVFEYLRTQIPILSISTKGGVLENVLNKTKSGKNFEYENIEGIKEYLLEEYQKWKKKILPKTDTNKTEIERYSRENLTKKLANVFDGLLE